MLRLVFAVLTGLIGAALLHLVIILSLPNFTGRDAFTRVMELGEAFRFWPVGKSAGPGLVNGDPYLLVAACSFDTAQAPVHLVARGEVPFWSLGVFDAAANEVFSMNDRTAVDGALDVVIATPVQLMRLRKALPEALAQAVLVEQTEPLGYAVLRALVPHESMRPAAQAFLAEAVCEPLR